MLYSRQCEARALYKEKKVRREEGLYYDRQ